MSIDGERPQVDVLLPTPTAELREAHLADAGVRLWLKRDDLIHPDLPGNKCRKLKYNLVAAAEQGHSTLLTFGGAYSNHIQATAAAGQLLGLATIGMIRGEEHLPLNPVLAFAAERGLRLTYLDRRAYRAKDDPVVLDVLRERFGDFFLLPEGGSNPLAVRGCASFEPKGERSGEHQRRPTARQERHNWRARIVGYIRLGPGDADHQFAPMLRCLAEFAQREDYTLLDVFTCRSPRSPARLTEVLCTRVG